uniref:Uncharacterized protein n=2 Tax=Meloidogyne TaxID=189290 RepID=A0A6V7Y6Q1_MELEN|nr:unnamed protein product [Meloidogyne enterolobii]
MWCWIRKNDFSTYIFDIIEFGLKYQEKFEENIYAKLIRKYASGYIDGWLVSVLKII